MRIAIDGRFYGLKNTGIGRYLMNLLAWLGKIDEENEYWVILNKEGWDGFEAPNERWHKMRVDVPHYSLTEQFVLPIKLAKIGPDLLHAPHFNVPVCWPGRMVVTIHDLLWHEWRGGRVTTLPPWLYWVKYLGFKLVFAVAVRKAAKIIVPSHWVETQLVSEFAEAKGKVEVTYEGVDDKLKLKVKSQKSKLNEYGLKKEKYLLYVGNVYSHKNVETLIRAMRGLRTDLVLAVVCGRDLFRERLEELALAEGVADRVWWLGFVPDEDLVSLYQGALCFVFPSLSEGFGLPGLEAMACGVPVIAARASSLPEVLGEAAVYFSGRDSEDLRKKVDRLVRDRCWREELIRKGKRQVEKYSWERMARQTLGVYQDVMRRR